MAGSNGKPTLKYGAAALAFMAVAVMIMAAACAPESRHGDGTDAPAMPPTVNHVPAVLEAIDNRRQSLRYAECLTETLSWRETEVTFDVNVNRDTWRAVLVQRPASRASSTEGRCGPRPMFGAAVRLDQDPHQEQIRGRNLRRNGLRFPLNRANTIKR